MKFVMQRDRVVNSVLGHAVGFKKGVPTHVPPALYEEVMMAGAAPEDEAELPKKDEPTMTAEDRKILLQAAIEELVTKNDAADFTAGGVPHVKALSGKTGFDVRADERDTAWAEFQAGKA